MLLVSQARSYTDPEAYKVYAAVLPDNAAWSEAHGALIREQTQQWPDKFEAKDVHAREPYRELADSAISDYWRTNRTRWKLQKLLPVGKQYWLIPETEFKDGWFNLGPGSPWPKYLNERNYPEVVELSAVGFNPDRTVAVVYNGHTRAGALLLLFKQKGNWKTVAFLASWKS